MPNTGTCLVILGVLVATHERQDHTRPDHGILTLKRVSQPKVSTIVRKSASDRIVNGFFAMLSPTCSWT